MITPAAGQGTIYGLSFRILTVDIPYTFTDFLFDLQLANTVPKNLVITTVELDGSVFHHTYNLLPHDTDLAFTIADTDGDGLSMVNLQSLPPAGGITLLKMFDISGVVAHVPFSVPEPSTWAMMPLGFLGLGLAALRRTGRSRPGGAMGLDSAFANDVSSYG
jgi:hypothetical protein